VEGFLEQKAEMMKRRGFVLGTTIGLMALLVTSAATARIDPRFDAAESYLKYVNTGEYRKAYDLLAWDISFEDFVARAEASNQGFAESLKEHGITLVSKKIERIDPMTFEDQYIIVAVRSLVVGKRGAETMEETVHYQVYFRFDQSGKIDLVHSIGEGWIC
jgi:hypothetical protein